VYHRAIGHRGAWENSPIFSTESIGFASVASIGRAIKQLPEPEMRRPLLLSLAMTVGVFILLWIAIGLILASDLNDNAWISWPIRVAGILATPALSWILFPSIATGILGLFADRIIEAVEHRYYPQLPPPPATRWGDQFRSMAVLMVLGVVLNIAVLPLYFFLPVANWVLFVGLNGYLFGRSFFDLVMLRRFDWGTVRSMWPRYRGAYVLTGMLLAALFSIPFANLLAPAIGTAAAVHLAMIQAGRFPCTNVRLG
jgi:uncharacterized protein involved in cysteine biosynthesis